MMVEENVISAEDFSFLWIVRLNLLLSLNYFLS